MHSENHPGFCAGPGCGLCLANTPGRNRSQPTGTLRVDSADRRAAQTVAPRDRLPSIAGMRNVLVHDYFEVDFETVWAVVTRDLPSLDGAMRAILATLDQPR
ncbi:MAG: DUF86 domain-containing protein [Bryobacteraceae bacterium]